MSGNEADAERILRSELDQNDPPNVIGKLVDLDPSELGLLSGVNNSVSFIPNKYIRRLRLLRIKYMQKALDTDLGIYWKKYLLLPVVLFDNCAGRSSNEIKISMSKTIDLVERER